MYFIDASTTETIVTDLKKSWLAKEIGESWENMLDWLAKQHKEWLLLLKNTDDTTLNLCNYFPHCTHGNTLITTQNREIIQHTSGKQWCFHVSGMDPSDAKKIAV